ncbi:MAG: DNA polymerase III subunit gamma/tau [Defluviitaleaceae bacterium]|nr:DNA polymerase III subunit gamma/tau [Defluviitaleaceae bacterium]
MTYTALYRKLRPTSFADIVGQDHIKATLINQIEHNRITHAYLFCGTRGTGKTTCAKVFARAVNCENPQSGEACGTCKNCEDIASSASLDVIEIDAASNNGVDNVRELREEVRYPAMGRYKVYIVDEVHMLSSGAFNALLKTLEEPPPHVIFILATTDPHKIPATIHSRLMRFDFHRISTTEMEAALARYMSEEGIVVSPDALAYVARLSDGSMRDALSILDRCASLHYGEEITLERARDITGSVDDAVFSDMTNALISKQTDRCLAIIEDLSAKGRDFTQFTQEMLSHLRGRLIAATTQNLVGYDDIMRLIAAFSEVAKSMRQSTNARLALEVMCIEEIVGKPNSSSENHNITHSGGSQQLAPRQQAIPKQQPEPPKSPKKKAIPDDIRNVLADWQSFISDFEPSFAPFIAKTKAGFLEDEHLYIVCSDIFTESHLRNRADYVAERLLKRYGLEFSVNIIAQNFYDDRHRKKYNLTDDFNYEDSGMEKLKSAIDFEIEEG